MGPNVIRGILLGGLLASRHLMSAVLASGDRSDQRWNGPRGHPVHILRSSLTDLLWSATLPRGLGSLCTVVVSASTFRLGACSMLRLLMF